VVNAEEAFDGVAQYVGTELMAVDSGSAPSITVDTLDGSQTVAVFEEMVAHHSFIISLKFLTNVIIDLFLAVH
jgi:hypothetical protein